jgi:uncharacterized repeat protein (TIGR01451 family)
MQRQHALLRLISYLITMAVISTPAWAAGDKNDVIAKLTAHKVAMQPDGKPVFQPADQAQPGDVIEYEAVYSNQGKGGVKGLIATMPIPSGMDYMPSTAKPAQAMASVDGQKFAPIPLKRMVKLPNGKEEPRDIPYEEYRYLRWEAGDLVAGSSVTVSMRARMSAGASTVRQANGGNQETR